MDLLDQYRKAQRAEAMERTRRMTALRAMVAVGTSQREIATSLGISQPAVSQQLRSADSLSDVSAEDLLEAAVPVLKALARTFRYRRLAVFGSLARGDSHEQSDIDLIVDPPKGTSSFEFLRFKRLVEATLGREVDLISYGGLSPGLDDDILRDLRRL